MRKDAKKDVFAEYPDIQAFVFSPCVLKVYTTGDDKVKSVECTIEGTEEEDMEQHVESFKLDAFKSGVYCDMKYYLQAFFKPEKMGQNFKTGTLHKTMLGRTVKVSLSVKTGQYDYTFTFNLELIWGAKRQDEDFNGHRELTYFTGYPFAFGAYAYSVQGSTAGSVEKVVNTLQIVSDKGTGRSVELAKGNGVYEVPISDTTDAANDVIRVNQDGKEVARINVIKGCDKGVYLRWLNRKGMFDYYLFKQGDRQFKTSIDSTQKGRIYATQYSYLNAGDMQAFNREETVQLCAPLVSKEVWENLSDISTSPIVQMYMGDDAPDKWVNILVATGSYTKTGATLQDFIFSIIPSTVYLQNI